MGIVISLGVTATDPLTVATTSKLSGVGMGLGEGLGDGVGDGLGVGVGLPAGTVTSPAQFVETPKAKAVGTKIATSKPKPINILSLLSVFVHPLQAGGAGG